MTWWAPAGTAALVLVGAALVLVGVAPLVLVGAALVLVGAGVVLVVAAGASDAVGVAVADGVGVAGVAVGSAPAVDAAAIPVTSTAAASVRCRIPALSTRSAGVLPPQPASRRLFDAGIAATAILPNRSMPAATAASTKPVSAARSAGRLRLRA